MQIAIVRKTSKLKIEVKWVKKIDEPKREKRLPTIKIELDLFRSKRKSRSGT